MFFTADGNELMNHFINEHIAARLAKRVSVAAGS